MHHKAKTGTIYDLTGIAVCQGPLLTRRYKLGLEEEICHETWSVHLVYINGVEKDYHFFEKKECLSFMRSYEDFLSFKENLNKD